MVEIKITVPGIEKLVEVVSEGLGVLGNHLFEFDVKKIKRVGEAEAEVGRDKIIKTAEGNAQAVQIYDRAQKRFALEQYNKQINLENIIAGSKEMLENQKVSDVPVDRDWAFRFMNIAQDVGREEVQKILSKILTEEIRRPKSFSLRTLDFVKNLSKDELTIFRKFSLITSSDSVIYVTKDNAGDGFFDMNYGEIMEMIEVGFIQPSVETVLNYKEIKDNPILNKIYPYFPLFSKDGYYYIFKYVENSPTLSLPILKLTTVGREISSLLEIEKNDIERVNNYLDDLKLFWNIKKLEFISKSTLKEFGDMINNTNN